MKAPSFFSNRDFGLNLQLLSEGREVTAMSFREVRIVSSFVKKGPILDATDPTTASNSRTKDE